MLSIVILSLLDKICQFLIVIITYKTIQINFSVTRPASSVAKRLGPPATKLFDKIHPQEQKVKVIKKDIFSRLGKEVPLVSDNYFSTLFAECSG